VFINWLLTREAQAAWAKELQTNSRFVGVEPVDPHAVVPPGLNLLQITRRSCCRRWGRPGSRQAVDPVDRREAAAPVVLERGGNGSSWSGQHEIQSAGAIKR
jgi:hypothetical protein